MARSFLFSRPGSYSFTEYPGAVPRTVTGPGILQYTTNLFRDDVRKGRKDGSWRPPQPYYAESYFRSLSTSWYRKDEKYVGDLGHALYTTPSYPEMIPGLRSRAEVQALLNLKDQSVNLAQFFAERKMTERLLLNTMKDITDAVHSVVRKDARGVERALGLTRRSNRATKRWKKLDPTNRWLEYQYGWVPLLSDVHGAAEALAKAPRYEMRQTVKARAFERSVREIAAVGGGGFVPVSFSVDEYVECKVSLTYIPNSAWFSQVMAQAGFGNPLYLQWELLPFSFVADWFLPIGNWLNSLDATNGYEFLGGSRTEYRIATARPMDASPASNNRTVGTKGKVRHMRFDRIVYSSSPIPTLPRMRSPWAVNGANRFANAMSLLRQAFK